MPSSGKAYQNHLDTRLYETFIDRLHHTTLLQANLALGAPLSAC